MLEGGRAESGLGASAFFVLAQELERMDGAMRGIENENVNAVRRVKLATGQMCHSCQSIIGAKGVYCGVCYNDTMMFPSVDLAPGKTFYATAQQESRAATEKKAVEIKMVRHGNPSWNQMITIPIAMAG